MTSVSMEGQATCGGCGKDVTQRDISKDPLQEEPYLSCSRETVSQEEESLTRYGRRRRDSKGCVEFRCHFRSMWQLILIISLIEFQFSPLQCL